MKVLITGATGLIGTELVNLLLEDNYEINYLSTSLNKIENKSNYSGYFWDLEKGIIDKNCLLGVDTIIHLAGATIAKRWTKSYKKKIIDSRVFGLDLIYDLLKQNKNQVKHIISSSGTAIYPDSYTEIYDEDSQVTADNFLANVIVKWEKSVDRFSEFNIIVTKLRTGVVYTNKGGAFVEMAKPIKMGIGSHFGSGKQIQSWIHLTDVANLYHFIIENKINGIINAVSPDSISQKRLTQLIAKKLNKNIWIPGIPQWIMKLILGEMHILLFDNKNILPKRALELGFKFEYSKVEKALDNILK